MASFDITSLYTNIPVNETVDITLDSLCDHDDLFANLKREELKKMLELASKDNVFYFDKVLYRQTDGCAMGSRLSGTLANIFMAHHEKKMASRMSSKICTIMVYKISRRHFCYI